MSSLLQKLGAGRLQTETVALVAAMTVRPNARRISTIDRMVRRLKATGLWTKLDALWVMACHDAQAAKLNWKSPSTFTLTEVNAPQFAPGLGYRSNDTSSYPKTGWIPNTHGVAFQTSDAHMGIFIGSNGTNGGDIGAIGTGFSYITARTGGNSFSAPFNMNTTTGATVGSGVTTSVGHTVVSRVGTAVRLSKNGVEGVASYTAPSATAVTRELYIGARNVNGTADIFSSRWTQIAHVGSSLSAADIANLYDIFNSYISTIQSPFVYVSGASYGGIPLGVDSTADGSAAAPYLTLSAALAAINPGQTILLNGDPASPTVYNLSAFFSVATGLSIDAVNPYGASITTSSSFYIFSIAPTNGEVVAFGKVILDGLNTAPVGVYLTPQTTLYNVYFNGTKLQNFTQIPVKSLGPDSKFRVYFKDAIITGADTQAAYKFSSVADGGIFVDGLTLTLTRQNAFAVYMMSVIATTQTVKHEVRRVVGRITIDDTLTSDHNHFVLRTVNCDDIIYENNDIEVTTSGPRSCLIYVATAAAGLYGRRAIIRNNRGLNGTAGGMVITIGDDDAASAAFGFVNEGQVYDNLVYGTSASNASLHGIFIGSGSNSRAYRNWVENVGIGLVDKEGNGSLWYDNIVVNCKSSYQRQKGSDNCLMTHNTCIATPGYTGDMQDVAPNVTTGNNGSGSSFVGNLYAALGLSAGSGAGQVRFSAVAVNQNPTFVKNDYYSDTAIASGAWNYEASNYGTIAAWQAAHEADAINVNPQFINATTHNYDVQSTSIDIVPANADVLTDYLGRAFASPASVGAYQKQ